MAEPFKRVGHFRDVASFRQYLHHLRIDLPVDDRVLSAVEGSPLARRITIGSFTVGNRWCIHPMEGWDGTPDGRPTEHTRRRWVHFGQSGAKLLWGGEAFAVQYDGRANPNQLYYRPDNVEPIRDLLRALTEAHRERFSSTDDLLVGLQLTHSGRFSRPNNRARLEPRLAYHHPVLDRKFGLDPRDDSCLLTDDQIKRLINNYIVAAQMAQRVGFGFVDVKCCHGYLGHEFLSAFDRPSPYGGDFQGRTRFLREVIQGIRAECSGLMIGVRLSVFDYPPFHPDAPPAPGTATPGAAPESGKLGPGVPVACPLPYPGFGCSRGNPLQIDLTEPIALLRMLRDELGVELVNLSAGSPYYNPHIQRPASFPPSDGYQPPEDPLIGCARQIDVVRRVKQALETPIPAADGAARPQGANRPRTMPLVGTAYSYFQEFAPLVAQSVVRAGWVDFVGLGRMVLSYWDLPADTLAGRRLQAKRICRTFSDCTTAPRNGIISGCYPLDEYYKDAPDSAKLKAAKAALRERLRLVTG